VARDLRATYRDQQEVKHLQLMLFSGIGGLDTTLAIARVYSTTDFTKLSSD